MQQEKPVVKLTKDDDAIFAPVAGTIAALWQSGKRSEAINVLLGWLHVGGQDITTYLERFVTIIDTSAEGEE